MPDANGTIRETAVAGRDPRIGEHLGGGDFKTLRVGWRRSAAKRGRWTT